jgi:tetratricopeptide (TPR) repeat protein
VTSPWQDHFGLDQVPFWLDAFAADPDQAVDALLRRGFYHGHLGAAEPEDLLIDWAWRLEGELVERLDPALARWVERFWGTPAADEGPALWADAWSTLALVVATVDGLALTARALRRRFGQASLFLGPLSVGPSRDPLGRYYRAVAAHQEDRSLAPFWWQLCDLPEAVPPYHARYALDGLRGLPPAPEEATGSGFPPEVVGGVVRVAKALARWAEEGRLDRAKEDFLALGHLNMAALPFRDHWREVLRTEEAPSGRAKDWVEELVREVRWQPRRAGPGDWAQRSGQIAENLRKGREGALREAELLLDEQRRHAGSTGTSSFLARSLCRFASSLRKHHAHQAIGWAVEARLWEPWSAYSWTTLTTALQSAGRLAEALEVAAQAVDRFPEVVVARTGLGEVLKATGRLDEAEAVYRETVGQFTQNVVARAGLGEVLKARGRLDEAEAVYRETVGQFTQNVVARNGLGEVLKARGRLDEAEAVYRETVGRFPHDVVARTGLGEVLKAAGRLDEAEAVYRETVGHFPQNVFARNGLGEVLKARGRLDEAEAVYRETVGRFLHDIVARTGLGEVLKAAGRLDEAEVVYRETVGHFPQNVVARNGLGEVLRAAGRLDEAEAVYREAVGRFPHDVIARKSLKKILKRTGRSLETLSTADDAVLTETSLGEEPKSADGRGEEVPALDAEVTALPFAPSSLLTSAKVFRRWARRGDGGIPPAELERRAGHLVDEALEKSASDPRALGEKALLLLESGRPAEARSLLAGALAMAPNAPGLLAALARAEREEAALEHRRLDEAEDEVLAAPQRLRTLAPAFLPLASLQEGRALLALTDGQVRIAKAGRAFDRLHREIRRMAQADAGRENDFGTWWSGEVTRWALGPAAETSQVTAADVPAIEDHQRRHAARIDLLEEVLVDRQVAAQLTLIDL